MPDKGRLYSPADGQPVARVAYTIYDSFEDGGGRKLAGEFTTDVALDTDKGYIIQLQNGLKLDCTVELYKPEPGGHRYRLYI